jgi:hypothetical protein
MPFDFSDRARRLVTTALVFPLTSPAAAATLAGRLNGLTFDGGL